MKAAKKPQNEAERLRVLHEYNILDTAADKAFDDLAEIASFICGTPIALVSLVDENRQWFKAKVGLEAEETPRDLAFCAHAILESNVFIVSDSLQDPRFADNPLVVGQPHVRFYAGAPLQSAEGHNLGTLCVIDHVPRELSQQQQKALQALARQVVAQLEARKLNKQLAQNLTELMESKEKYTSLVDHMNEVVFQTDKNGNWIFLNKAWSELTGFSVQECLGKNFLDFVHADDRLRNLKKFRPLIEREKESCRHEVRYLCKDGSHRWVEVYARLSLDKNNQENGTVGTLTDITDRKESEKILIETRENAIESAHAKAVFLANMSHEIRTPMNGILGMASLLIDSKLEQKQFDYVKTIKHSADALLELINDILDFSKVEAGKMELEITPFDVRSLLQQTIEILKITASKNDTDLRVEIAPDMPEVVIGDPFRLRQIFTNLIGNAIKFTPHGNVLVTAKLMENQNGKVRLQFSVVDTGIGIPKEALQKIFEAFSQADNSTTRKYGGTGLGLSITERLVRLMNGQIRVQSEVGQGSNFTFEVEMSSASEKQVLEIKKQITYENEKQNVNQTKTGRILIAEDNLINQKVFVGLLHGCNYHIDIVDNGKKAVEAIRNQKYDLILMDCQMPEMDGYEATVKIRNIEKTRSNRLPIIAVTANAMKNERDKCHDVGMDDYISKPISGPRLIEVIEKWLPATPENFALLDQSVLDQLQQMGQESKSNLLEEVVEIFLKEAPGKIQEMNQQFKMKDFDKLAKTAHHFKSSCNGIGAKTLAKYCEGIEQNCALDGAPIQALLTEIASDYSKIEKHLQR